MNNPEIQIPLFRPFREIPLSRDQFALVDADNYERFIEFRWQAHWHPKARTFYVTRKLNRLKGRPAIWMHREVLGLGRICDDSRHGDHINHNGLDCRRDNLRIATIFQNAANRRMRSDNRSGFKGVYYHRANNKWVAQVTCDGKQRYLGIFESQQEAHRVYCDAAKLLQGEFALIQTREMLNAS